MSGKISYLRVVFQLFYLAIFLLSLISYKFIFVFIIATAVVIGPFFCGWMCFVGFYQDIVGYVAKLLKINPLVINQKVQNYLSVCRYILLLGSVLALGVIFMFPSIVWYRFSTLIKGNLVVDGALIFLIIVGFVSLFIPRFFCRYFCTFGAKLGIYSLLRPVTINRDETCIHCNECSNHCPMGIDVEKCNSLAHPSCIDCLKCAEICPKSCLKIGLRNYLKP